MLRLKKSCAALALSLMFAACGPRDDGSDFNEGWLFVRDSLAGAEAVKYDVSAWKTVDLPHDFSMEPLPAGENTLGPFSRETKGGRSVGYLPGGTGWYRKTFRLPRTDAGKSVALVFDGAYMQTDVWVNGRPAASHKNVSIFTDFEPFDQKEMDFMQTVADLYKSNIHIPCTACSYCMPCPHGVNIPGNFRAFNTASDQLSIPDPDKKGKDFGKKKKAFLKLYNELADGTRADACISCNACLPKCSQHIRIPEQMKMISELVAKL